jgi:8-oxo-dGTP pyrophosphatase MutT (NUDIX family)
MKVQQAGAIAVRPRGSAREVFMVRAKRNPDDWIFPKGHVEKGESPAEAAVRELREEGGVVGEAADLVGVSSFRAGEREIEVSYYLVWFSGTAPADEIRESQWITFDRARSTLTYEDARRYVDVVARMVRTD